MRTITIKGNTSQLKEIKDRGKSILPEDVDDYKKKIEMSKSAGRKKKIDDKQIYDLAKAGKTAQEVADTLGISKSAVDKSDGWRNRKNEEFVF